VRTLSSWKDGHYGRAVSGRVPSGRRVRRAEARSPLAQIAKDFWIGEGTLNSWLKRADVEDGARPGVTQAHAAELRELRKRNRLLEQENEILRRAAAFFARELPPK
jgi:transposase